MAEGTKPPLARRAGQIFIGSLNMLGGRTMTNLTREALVIRIRFQFNNIIMAFDASHRAGVVYGLRSYIVDSICTVMPIFSERARD